LLSNLGTKAPFFAAAALTFVNWLYGYFVLPESLKPENRRKFEWRRANPVGTLEFLLRYKVILGLVASIVLLSIGAHAVQSTWAFYTMEKFKWNPTWVGYSLGVVGLLVGVVQGLLIRIILPKLGQQRGIYVGLALYSLGYVLFAFATEGWMMFVFLIPYCLGGIAGPSLQGVMSGQVPPNQQGELQGALTSLMSLTSIVGPIFMTSLFHAFTKPGGDVYFPGAIMIAAAVLTLISAFLARLSLKKNKKPVSHSPVAEALEVPGSHP
jgi:DHA1 family tetracycline resistance protein-like MFS transporter